MFAEARAEDGVYKLCELWITDDLERQLLQDNFHQMVIWVVAAAHNLAVPVGR